MGALDAEDFERFLSEGAWRGKAGSYNLPEVVARGWPVSCEGDPQTVVGLPAEKLAPMLRAALARRGVSSRAEDDA
jgi:predicted house-cleaning NTP pyrophosphatase (Maf/HAM1 superfamily)